MKFSHALGISILTLAAVYASAARASTTILDGSPVIFDELVIGDFNDGTVQGWQVGTQTGGVFLTGTELQNNVATTGPDPQVFLGLGDSTLPGVPGEITVGNLPGQYDIVQFRLRFDSIPGGLATVRGDQFFLIGAPTAREAFFVNDGSGMQAGDTVPELPTDGQYHTYTIQRAPTDTGWGNTFSQVRIDPINTPSSVGTLFSLDEIKLARSNNVQPFAAFATPVPTELIANGDFENLTNPTPPGVANAYNLIGSNSDFTPFHGQTAIVDDWTPYFEDPDGLVPAIGQPFTDDPSGNELNGTFYLDTIKRIVASDIAINSANNYVNGLVQEDILNGVTIDPNTTYELSFDFGHNVTTNQSQASFSLALTVGTGAAATDIANAVPGTLVEITDFTGVPNPKQTTTIQISGADLAAAQSSGQVNLALELVNEASIPGFPGSVDPNDIARTDIVSQILIDKISLLEPFPIPLGDVNKDGVLDQADVDQAQDYLDGDGGDLAVDRQNTLIAAGNTSADVLAALNLTDFDFTGDDFFDAADVAFLDNLVNGGLTGDFNSDSRVDGGDFLLWQRGGSPNPFSASDLEDWENNYGMTALRGAVSAVPEPTSMVLLVVCLTLKGTRRRAWRRC